MKCITPLVIILFALASISAQQSPILTNESVVEMVKAGIPASVIVTKIKNSQANFNTELPALKSLTEAMVPEAVISAMIERAAVKAPEATPAVQEPLESVKESPRTPSPAFTPYSLLGKKSQKERIKSAARIDIAASAAKVTPLLIQSLQSWEYQIETESSRALMFSKPVRGVGNQLLVGMAMGGNNMRYKVQVSISEYQGVSSVIVSAWLTSDNAFGKTTQESMDRQKKWREQLDNMLFAVKMVAEQPVERE